MRQFFVAALVALVVCPVAAAHGEGGARGYKSTPIGLRPPLEGVRVRVLDGDDALQLRNRSGEEIVVLGYSGEPYLRFAPDGIFLNALSPAAYLNLDRYARAEVPEEADPELRPRWQRVSSGQLWSWHDHRIHWMSRIPPPKVREEPEERHSIFSWRVPLRVGGRPRAIRGELEYVPPGGEEGIQARSVVLPVLLAIGGTGLVVLLLVLVRRKPPGRPSA